MDDVSDLLDLCRLNLMEEHIINSYSVDREKTLQIIDVVRRQLIVKIKLAVASPDAMERHIRDNTVNGIYPWTDGCIVIGNDVPFRKGE